MSLLTKSERSFLQTQGYALDRVYDAQGQRAAEWKAAAKAVGADIVVGKPCKKGGHRLRTRAGHCVQCDTKKLAYQQRHRSDGYIYVAGSLRARLIKVGIATDIDQRLRNLRNQRYGGVADWAMLFHANIEMAGQAEKVVHALLRSWRVPRIYEKDGEQQIAGEIFAVPCSKAIDAVSRATGDVPQWRAHQLAPYEFDLEEA